MSDELYEQVVAPASAVGVLDGIGLNARDPTGNSCVLISPLREKTRLPRRLVTLGSRVAAHIAAGARLRGALVDRDPWHGAEAILDTRGRLQHADRSAQTPRARHVLREAAAAIDRARTRRRRPDVFETVGMWPALVAGRWTVIDRIDSDGRRLFIARKNDPDTRHHHALTPREQQVVGYAALGHPNKLIGYEMGLSASTVATHLAEAARKLGVSSRAALIQLVSSFCGPRDGADE